MTKVFSLEIFAKKDGSLCAIHNNKEYRVCKETLKIDINFKLKPLAKYGIVNRHVSEGAIIDLSVDLDNIKSVKLQQGEYPC